jgi:hypothetical protein
LPQGVTTLPAGAPILIGIGPVFAGRNAATGMVDGFRQAV